jgi:hypothetical protein
MNVVYMTIIKDRKEKNLEPYYYIGSKANCFFDGTNIITNSGKKYFGSSRWKGYKQLCIEGDVETIILGYFEDYDNALDFEKNLHIFLDVVSDTKYFNKAVATISNYSNPEYGTYRNARTGDFVKLKKDHPLVINGEYVNANYGYKTYNDGNVEKQFLDEPPDGWSKGRIDSNKRYGEDSSFYGKMHTQDSKCKMLVTRKNFYDENPERYAEVKKINSEVAIKNFRGVPKSPESNKKRSRKDMIMLKNKNTGVAIRIKKEEMCDYDLTIWQNPYKLAHEGKPNKSRWATNGDSNIKLKAEEPLPKGFYYGRKNRYKKDERLEN